MRATLAIIAACSIVCACKPPPTDAGLDRDLPQDVPTYASEPLPSPDVEGAVWAPSPKVADRIIYGVPGEPAIMAMSCRDGRGLPRVRITRMSPADEGAGALLALVGNGHIGRMPVDAVEVSGKFIWQGEVLAADSALEPLAGPRQLTATIPGAGLVTLNASDLPMTLLEDCRGR